MTKASIIIISLAPICICGVIASGDEVNAETCNLATVTSHGTATSEGTAKRNALVSLKSKLDDLYPGEFRSRMSGAVEYECKNPLLWRCLAKAKVCR